MSKSSEEGNTMLSADLIALYFIWKAQKEKKELTNKKLQKLLYYAQAWNLVFKNKPLFEEKIEAWVHGPAIPVIYRKYKKFEYRNINVNVDEEEIAKISDDYRKILNMVFDAYGKYPTDYLEILSHSEEPWQKSRTGYQPYESCNQEISLDEMKKFYGKLYEQKKKELPKR